MAGVIGSLVSYGLNQLSQERSFDMQKELQQDAQNYNSLMWNRNNQYNSAAAQMQRFKSAGLNPNLIYGQQSNATAPTISAGSAPSPAQAPPMSALETAQLALLRSQKDNIDADTDVKRGDKGVKDAQANLLTTQEIVERADLKIRQDLADANIALTEEQTKNVQESTKKIAEETNGIIVENAIRELDRQYLEKSMDDRIKLLKAQIRQANSAANLSDAQAARIATLMDQELSNLKAEFSEITSRTDLNRQQKSNLAQQKAVDAADNFYLLLAQEYHQNGNFMERSFGAVGAELVHFISHVLRFSVK